MTSFSFNTIYIIESLRDDEPKTGESLYNDLSLQQYIHRELTVNYAPIKSGAEWDNMMRNILHECQENNVLPIIHLEIHGCDEGLSFTNGDFRSVLTITEQFREINFASKCNLFVTLGVCKGLYLSSGIRLEQCMPFCGVVGSWDILSSYDIKLRYAAFYGELFRSLNVPLAMKSLFEVEQNSKYRYIPIDEIFYKSYQDYITYQCTEKALKERAYNTFDASLFIKNRRNKRKFKRDFIKVEKKTRLKEYHDAVKHFFATEQFKENVDRFEIPQTFNELKERYQNLIVHRQCN